MNAALAAAWHDAQAGFMHHHGQPGFWAACLAVAVIGLFMAHEARS